MSMTIGCHSISSFLITSRSDWLDIKLKVRLKPLNAEAALSVNTEIARAIITSAIISINSSILTDAKRIEVRNVLPRFALIKLVKTVSNSKITYGSA